MMSLSNLITMFYGGVLRFSFLRFIVLLEFVGLKFLSNLEKFWPLSLQKKFYSPFPFSLFFFTFSNYTYIELLSVFPQFISPLFSFGFLFFFAVHFILGNSFCFVFRFTYLLQQFNFPLITFSILFISDILIFICKKFNLGIFKNTFQSQFNMFINLCSNSGVGKLFL